MNFYQFRQQRLAKATRAFNARGITVKRCEQCQLPLYACICNWKPSVKCQLEVILIMHSDEILKPSNTGHLISEVLGDNCHLFEWSRTEPAAELLQLLNQKDRQYAILFPPPLEQARQPSRPITIAPTIEELQAQSPEKKLTLVVLDGTWRQCKRMFNQSQWLYHIPCFDLDVSQQAQYKLRKSVEAHQLATAEAAALAFAQWQQIEAAHVLQNYFAIFNQHYAASKLNVIPQLSHEHSFLQNYLDKSVSS
ncbi:tRNA-uridine aminocarboxypropyltransferase [Catenovulum agarivorans]|uniref:tRNA-uridine aminocarboxypropyltransferase n=1 Tax=Catenovulum agarivorans TaxID=1172192 RepID=UPI0012FB9245|nr:DTW domain-containing protein [Catenovulum agarivorans]